MPLPAPAPREPVHTREIVCKGYHRDDGLWDIEGHLVDTKSYAFDNSHRGEVKAGQPIHGMWLRITIDDQLLIHEAVAVTDDAPYAMCPDITPNFAHLAGIRIGPGWQKEVNKRVGGTLGCTHLVELLRPLATTAFQTLVALRRYRGEQTEPLSGGRSRPPRWLDTCHAHASDSPVTRERWPEFYTGPDREPA